MNQGKRPHEGRKTGQSRTAGNWTFFINDIARQEGFPEWATFYPDRASSWSTRLSCNIAIGSCECSWSTVRWLHLIERLKFMKFIYFFVVVGHVFVYFCWFYGFIGHLYWYLLYILIWLSIKNNAYLKYCLNIKIV